MAVTDGFVDAILDSPLGVTLLARLESRVRFPEGRGLVLETTPKSVGVAADAVHSMTLGDLARLAVLAGQIDVGPWISGAPDTVAAAYRQAEARAPIAEALNDRFGPALHRTMLHDAQQWWTTADLRLDRLVPLFRDYENVYGAGSSRGLGCGP